jgi:glucose 1-dehydrogenase
VIDVNLTGVFLSTQLAARQMVAQGRGGAIINIASIMAIQGAGGASNYCAAKAGVVSLTKSAALALAPHGIRVNGIGPGFIETAMTAVLREESAMRHNLLQQTPMNAFGEPLDVANAALFLACDESKFMTGQTLFPDGGYLLNYVAPSPELIETQMRLAADASG